MDPALPPDDDLDRLLRPPRRGDAIADSLARLRALDRRAVVAGATALVAAVVAVVVLTSPADPAAVVLPRAQAEPGPGPTSGSGAALVTTTNTAPDELVVHVAGAVAHPGLVTVPAGTRAADALAAAGGAAPGADLDRVNLAGPLTDGSRLYIPAIGQTAIPNAVAASPGSAASGDAGTVPADLAAPVDLNQATSEQLETLPGVGPATAAAILAHRDAHGPFASVDALDEVRGIGPAKLEQLRPLVVVG